MGMTLNELVPGTVAITINDDIAVITGHNLSRPKYPISYKVKASPKGYKGRPEDFRVIIGKVDVQAFLGACEASAVVPAMDWSPYMPEPLKSMNIGVGDVISVRHGHGVVQAVFKGWNPGRPKYPITYDYNGKSWKGVVAAVVGKVAKVEAVA